MSTSLLSPPQSRLGPASGSSPRVGIVGACGTTGVELARLLTSHPFANLRFGTSRGRAGGRLDEVDPAAPPLGLIHPDEIDPQQLDLAFLCLPHGESASRAAELLRGGVRVVDLSADFRLAAAETHRAVYGSPRDEELAARSVYGLTEFAREAIRGADLVANPGCYPTCIGLALLPLAEVGVLRGRVVADALSGVSGAGRTPTEVTHFCSASADVRPYKVGRQHRHVAEVEQSLAAAGAADSRLIFNPHLVPVERGMLATLTLAPDGLDAEGARATLAARYADEPFVTVLPGDATVRMRHAAGTNRAVVAVHDVPGGPELVVTSAIDNLGKGAAGQAIQNFNLMAGLPEATGLLAGPHTHGATDA